AVATAGDVNGDGFSDVVFGARHFSNGQSLEGRAQLHYGRASSLSILTGVARETTVANGRSGSAVAAAGDVNGDGFGDWIVGAPFHSNGETEEGMARAYHGTTSTPAWVFESNQA